MGIREGHLISSYEIMHPRSPRHLTLNSWGLECPYESTKYINKFQVSSFLGAGIEKRILHNPLYGGPLTISGTWNVKDRIWRKLWSNLWSNLWRKFVQSLAGVTCSSGVIDWTCRNGVGFFSSSLFHGQLKSISGAAATSAMATSLSSRFKDD